MPVNEVLELGEVLRQDFRGDISVICNQISVSGLSSLERQTLADGLTEPNALQFLKYTSSKESQQKKQMQRLKDWQGNFIGLPQVLKNVRGLELIEEVLPSMEQAWDLTNS